jgi:uncharacterized protein (DUF983 family)
LPQSESAILAYLWTMDEDLDATVPRSLPTALLRGLRKRCPNCGTGRLFNGYLSVNRACPACGEDLHHQRADDAPAYFTMIIVGHFVVGGVLYVERMYSPPMWMQAVGWLSLTLVLALWLLPRIKGMLIGLQWALRMHGFGGPANETPLELAAAAPTLPGQAANR